MPAPMEIIQQVRAAAAQNFLFLPHALRQMARPDRMISGAEVRRVVERGYLVESYSDDVRGHSCLLFGQGDDNRALHVVCSPKDEYLAVITAYLPSAEEWENDFKTRKNL